MVILSTIHTPRGTWRVEAHQQGTAYWYSISYNGKLHTDRLTVGAAVETVQRLARDEIAALAEIAGLAEAAGTVEVRQPVLVSEPV